MGNDYPVGIWGNSYDAFYWGETARRTPDYIAPALEVHQGRVPVVVGDPGLYRHAVPRRGIKKANSTDSDKVAKALLGLTIDTPIGKQTIREKDHQANRGQLYGKTVMDPKYPFADHEAGGVRRPHQFMDYAATPPPLRAARPRAGAPSHWADLRRSAACAGGSCPSSSRSR